MKHLLVFASLSLIGFAKAEESELFRNPGAPLESRVSDLLGRLSLEEKAQVLNHKGPTVERIGLRADQWNQCLNGIKWDRPATMFPTCIAMAATWNKALVEEVASVISDEARAIYNGWHLEPGASGEHKGLIYRAPVINIGRNPYWGRNHEAWGEDPFLTGRMGVACIRGLQGHDPKYLKVAATLKHYAVNNVETERTKLNAVVSEKVLREYWLPHFRDCIVEGQAQSVMASYNALNGVANNINHWLLTDVLKKEWKHEGFVVSDLGGVKTMVEGHGAGKVSYVDAVAQSVMAGCDFSDKEYEAYIPAAVKEGKLSEERLNDAVRRVLRVRMKLGEFDPFDSVPYSKISPSVVGSAAHRAVALKVAQQSIVLLENRGRILPLEATALRRVAVLGPLANRVTTNNYFGKHEGSVTGLQGLKSRLPAECEVVYTLGADLGGKRWGKGPEPELIDREAELKKAVELARGADVAIVFIGTNETLEHEGRDRSELGLPAVQENLVKAVLAVNPRTIVVQMSGGPLTEPWMAEHVPAMLQAWWGGGEGGNAVADVLLGNVNPGGRLPHTVYASATQVPPLDEYDVSKGFTYMYLRGKPLYAFGYGLSFTEFGYSALGLSSQEVSARETLTVEVEVKNLGQRAGDEVVQLYVRELDGGPQSPQKELRGFERVSLEPNSATRVRFEVPVEKLARWNESKHAWIVKPGGYEIQIGSPEVRVSGKFVVTD